MNVYVSESDVFKNFNDSSALFWSLKEIEYGNWNIGENNDGTITYDGQIPLTKVIFHFDYSL